MRLSKEVYDGRMLNIIAAFLRLVYAHDNEPERIPVKLLVFQYGFTRNFSKTDKLRTALLNLKKWIDRERARTGISPSPERMLNFVKNRL